jgi:hypothetical protein
VDFLIDEENKQWKEDLVRARYSEDTADMILKIPLSHNTCEDFVSWEPYKEGIFTVKSAYIFAKSEFYLFSSTNGKGGTSNITQVMKDWKHIWKINAPGKMKIVLWMLAHDFTYRTTTFPSTHSCLPLMHVVIVDRWRQWLVQF